MIAPLRSTLALVSLLACTSPCMAVPSKKSKSPPPPAEVVIDAVVASVDDKPITLSDLCSRLYPPRKLDLTQAAADPEALKVLDQIIAEKLLEEEAKTKRLSVADSEVDDYIQEVSARNNLSPKDFQTALKREGKTLESYKYQVKFDILKAKLASSITRGGMSLSDSEIDEYIAAHPELTQSGKTIKLHHIVISKQDRTPAEVGEKVTAVTTALDEGEKFTEVAQRLSDNAGSPEGSLLGVVAEQDLSPEISEAISSLEVGQHSKPVESQDNVQLFYVEQRFSADDDDDDSEEKKEALRTEVRQVLQKQKVQERLSNYFLEDLYKNHAVDKRL